MGWKAYGELKEVDQLAFVKSQLAGAIAERNAPGGIADGLIFFAN
jgi:hypothetical protein